MDSATFRIALTQPERRLIDAIRGDTRLEVLPGADHGTVITQSMPEIFKFFEAHTR